MARFKITLEGTTEDIARFTKEAKTACDALTARLANEGGHTVARVTIAPVVDEAPADAKSDAPAADAKASSKDAPVTEATKKG